MSDRKRHPSADPFKLTMMIFAVIAFLYFTGEVLKPLALSVLLSFALAPAVQRLEGRGLPRAAAVVLTGLLIMGVLGSVISQPSFQERLRTATGPYLEFLGVGSFVLVLVLFILMGREDLRDRIVTLFGHQQVSLTTRTMEEIAQRISRYLATFALVNSGFGLFIGLGLWAIGVPFAVMWGVLAALMRFIPYVGPAVAFVLPLATAGAAPGALPRPATPRSLRGVASRRRALG